MRRRIDGSNRKCWPSRLLACRPAARSRLLGRPAGSDPDVDEGVPAQVAQVAAGLALELLLLERLAHRLAVAAPAAACRALVADLEDVHAGRR